MCPLTTALLATTLATASLTDGWTLPSQPEMEPVRGHGRDFAADMVADEVLDRVVAGSDDHTAKVVSEDGFARLLVDGKAVPPILFKGGRTNGAHHQFGGKRMRMTGVPFLVATVRFGTSANVEGPWTTNGFDVAAAIVQTRRSMRTAPEALYALTLQLDAPVGWCDTRTNEIWRTRKGEVLYGNSGHLLGPRPDPSRKSWPWASNHSTVWRDAVKAILTEYIAELRRTGLSKRIVGVHLAGSHDAQFATAAPDWSTPARVAFAASGETDYAKFLKRAPMRLQDDFARHVRRCFGKDIVVFRWCMAAFGGNYCSAHDIREFADSKEIDIIVPQPVYARRKPGVSLGVKLPFASLHAKGKLLMHEHDLRTYAAWPRQESAEKAAGLSRAKDIDEWRIIDRKTAGQMIARRTGFWYYDMESGWFDFPEIAADIASVVETARPFYCEKPTPWHPSAAFVIDEEDLLDLQRTDGENERATSDINAFIVQIAESGVPFDVWMKGDFDAAQAARYAYVVRYDRRTSLKSAADLNTEAKAAGAYVPLPPNCVQVDMNGDFVSLHCLRSGRYEFLLPRDCTVVNLKSGRTVQVAGRILPLELSMGETCWFRLGR